MITAAVASHSFLEPTLEARALNLQQHALLLNPSPEPDSVLEILKLLAAPTRSRGASHGGGGQSQVGGAPCAAHLATLARLTRQLAESNQREGFYERQVAGHADRLVRDLRDLSLNGGGEAILASKAIARAVRGPLRTIRDATTIDREVIEALRELDRVLARAPRCQVLSHTVEHEIGARSFSVLRTLTEERRPG